jgi:LysR family transcriptional regulator, transcriptional activator of the cysJI operon
VSQPSVSARIQRLEAQLHEPLFERVGRGVRLTATGETLRPLAERALAIAQESDDVIAGIAGLVRGRIRGAASTTIAGYVLPAVLARFVRDKPAVDVDVRVGNTSYVAAAVERGHAAWGLVEGPVDAGHFDVTRFLDDELILIVPADHPWAVQRSIEPAALNDAPFVAREPGSGTSAIYETALAAHGVRIRPRIRLAHSRGIVAAVAEGAGVAIVSALVAMPLIGADRLARIEITGVDLARPFNIITRPGRSVSRLDADFLDVLRAAASARLSRNRTPAKQGVRVRDGYHGASSA